MVTYKSSVVAALQDRPSEAPPDGRTAAAARQESAEAIRWLGLSEADRLARGAAALLHRFALPVARAAAVFVDKKGWFLYGYARRADYSREVLSRSGRWLSDMADLGLGIARRPELAAALTGDDGAAPIGQVAAQQVARVATPESLAAWLALARRVTVRRLKDEVRRARAARTPFPLEQTAASAAAPPEADWDETPDDERVQVDLSAPGPVKAAFYCGLELHRLIEGGSASVSSFVEALCADYSAGPAGHDARVRGLHVGPSAAERERAVESRRRFTRDDAPPDLDADLLRAAREALLEAARLVESSDAKTSGEVGDRLLRLTTAEHAVRVLLGRLLAHLGELRAWRWLGCADLGHYAERRLGIARATAQDLAQLARTAAERPRFAEDYESGHVKPAAALAVARFLRALPANDDTERWWLTHAAQTTVKRLRREVGLRRFDCWMQRTIGPARPLDDHEWRRRQRRQPGQALDEILACARATADHPFADESLALRLPRPLAERFLATIDAAAEALTTTKANREDDASSGRMFSTPCFRAGGAPPASSVGPAAETDKPPSWLGLLHVLASFAATFDPPGKSETEVLDRDGWCCQAPACTGRRNLEQHHVTYRSEGGNDDLDNLITLCRFHHQRGEHDGLMSVSGRAPDDLTFRLGPAHRGAYFRDERRVARLVTGAR